MGPIGVSLGGHGGMAGLRKVSVSSRQRNRCGRSDTRKCVVVGASCCVVVGVALACTASAPTATAPTASARTASAFAAAAPVALRSAAPLAIRSAAPVAGAPATPINSAFAALFVNASATPFIGTSATPSISAYVSSFNAVADSPRTADDTLPFSFPVGDELSAPTHFWRDGRLVVTRTFRSRSALPVVAARLSAQMRAAPTLITVPGGLLMSGKDNSMWWSVHLQDASTSGTHGTIVGSPMRVGADGVTPLAPASPALPRWVPPGGMAVLDTRAVDGTRCHIHRVLTFPAPAASTLGDFDIALDREGWVLQPGSTSTSIHHWQRAGMRLELVVVPRDGGSGAVLHLVAPLPSASLPSTSLPSASSLSASSTPSFFAPSRSSLTPELPCKDF